MSKRPHKQPSDPQPPESDPLPPKMPSPLVRRLIGLAVTLHVAAVFLGPFSVAPASPLGRSLRGLFRPYIEAADLDYGYRFFAPEPGPGNSFKAVLKFADGRTEEKTFPDLDAQWPRLFYHRHMMLSESLYSFYDESSLLDNIPRDTPEFRQAQRELASDLDPAARARRRQISDAVVHGYTQQILRKYDATELTLFGITRFPPTAEEVRRGQRLADPRNVRQIKLGTFRRGEQ